MDKIVLPPEIYEELSEEEIKEHEELCQALNWLSDEGFVEYEEDENGELRFYPTDA